ncbi:MAG: hypothetical protein ACON4M_05080 [Crocinitomicaceae bacterium]
MKKIISIIVFVHSFMLNIYSQKEFYTPIDLNNNSMYVNAGSLLLYNTLNVNYEHMIKQHLLNTNISSFAKVGVGIFEVWGGSGGYSMVQMGLLTGENKHHLELSAGLSLNIPRFGWGDEPIGYPFATNFGWRIQKPDKNSIFRLGIGLPEGVYCGLGFSF